MRPLELKALVYSKVIHDSVRIRVLRCHPRIGRAGRNSALEAAMTLRRVRHPSVASLTQGRLKD
jgi:hypothetical protein